MTELFLNVLIEDELTPFLLYVYLVEPKLEACGTKGSLKGVNIS